MRILSKVIWAFGALGATALTALAVACSGSSSGDSSTSPTPTPPPGSTTATTTITIANNAVSPKNISVALGSRVTFVNNDSRPHDMASNPHPEHTDCPEINQVGFLSPGQSRQTGNLNTARTCGFHDHEQDVNTGLQGTITIQ